MVIFSLDILIFTWQFTVKYIKMCGDEYAYVYDDGEDEMEISAKNEPTLDLQHGMQIKLTDR